MVVIFEGMDKTGKTTLKDAFNKATDFKHIVLDRSVISSYVYDKIYNRNFRDGYKPFEDAISKIPHIVILCDCSNAMMMLRLSLAKEKLPEQQRKYGIDAIRCMFLNEMEKSSLHFKVIDTDCKLEESLIEVIDIVKEEETKWN